jgi:hypothetical protein
VAEQDYFSGAGSKYGQLAGSLLSSRRRRKKKDIITLLALSGISEALGQKGLQLKEDVTNAAAEVTDQYTDIFQDNKDIWEANDEKRAALAAYENEYSRDTYLNSEAIRLFNEDPELQAQYGANPWNRVKKFGADALADDEYQLAMDVKKEYRDLAELNVKSYREKPEIGKFKTWTQFNAKAKKEFKAALTAVKDDPTKKGAIRAWINEKWGYDKDGTPRFGMIKKAELELAVENAKANRLAQDKLTESELVYLDPEKEEVSIYEKIIAAREKYTTFTTNAEQIKVDLKTYKTKIESGDFDITDLETFFSLGGTTTTNIPALDQVNEHERENFINIYTEVTAIRDQLKMVDPERAVSIDITDYLDNRKRDIYDLGMGIQRDKGKDVNDQMKNETLRQIVFDTITLDKERNIDVRIMLETLDGDFIWNEAGNKDASTKTSNVFISEVIRAATKLENKYNMEPNEALSEAYKLQKEGIWESQEWLGRDAPDIYRGIKKDRALNRSFFEYVDPDFYTMPLLPETATEYVDYINNSNWFQQNRTFEDTDGNEASWNPDINLNANGDFVVGPNKSVFTVVDDEERTRWEIKIQAENTGRTRINPNTDEEEDIYEWVPLYRFIVEEIDTSRIPRKRRRVP